jgi:tetratricopeptide (TPR) repeat protein
MPQVFSAGWLYLFIIIMVISLVRIWLKVRTLHQGPEMDRPVVRLTPIGRDAMELGEQDESAAILAGPDSHIREGRFQQAVDELESLLPDLSPVEDREIRGQVLYRMGACLRRMAAPGDGKRERLKAGEALRESVTLLTPERFRVHYLRSLSELASLYEELADIQSPLENLNLALRTWEKAVDTASNSSWLDEEVRFLTRKAAVCRNLADHSDRQASLRMAVESYRQAAATLEAIEDPETLLARVGILKMGGDTLVELAEVYRKEETLASALVYYDQAFQLMPSEGDSIRRGVTLADSGRVLLELYDCDQSPAHLRRALRVLRDSLELLNQDDHVARKGLVMAVMARALTRYAEVKEPRENYRRAVKLFEAAMGILKDPEYAGEREKIKEELRIAVGKLSAESNN